jgi:predicted ester cyclase
MLEINKAIAERFCQEVWGKGDLRVADEILALDLVDHNGVPGQGPGREGHKDVLRMFRGAFPNLSFTTDDVIAEGDKVVLRYTAFGTHQGDLMGIPPTQKRITMEGIEILRIVEGRIIERWSYDNELSVMQQLGVVLS